MVGRLRLFACGREGEMADPVLLHAILTTGDAGLLRAGELCRRERTSEMMMMMSGCPSSYKPPNLRDEARIKLVSNEESKHDV